jgi:hypothetical protein
VQTNSIAENCKLANPFPKNAQFLIKRASLAAGWRIRLPAIDALALNWA